METNPKTAEPTPLALVADRIAKRLFLNGAGETAKRLVLMSATGKDLGGWCYAAVKKRILAGLQAATPETTAETGKPGPVEFWAIVEVMGHARSAGRVTEYTGLGVPLVRVEIPAVDGHPAAEILLGQAAIFRVTPCTEHAARVAARQFAVRPLALVELRACHKIPPPAWLDRDDLDDDHDPDDD